MPEGSLERLDTGQPGLQGQAGQGFEQMGENGNFGQEWPEAFYPSGHSQVRIRRPQSEARGRRLFLRGFLNPGKGVRGMCTKMDLEFIKIKLIIGKQCHKKKKIK